MTLGIVVLVVSMLPQTADENDPAYRRFLANHLTSERRF
jgi:hypothetical protein